MAYFHSLRGGVIIYRVNNNVSILPTTYRELVYGDNAEFILVKLLVGSSNCGHWFIEIFLLQKQTREIEPKLFVDCLEI